MWANVADGIAVAGKPNNLPRLGGIEADSGNDVHDFREVTDASKEIGQIASVLRTEANCRNAVLGFDRCDRQSQHANENQVGGSYLWSKSQILMRQVLKPWMKN